jgi:hypothetical protein
VAADIWRPVDLVEFGHWVQSSNDEVTAVAKECWKHLKEIIPGLSFCFLFKETNLNIEKCRFVIFEPEFELETLEYKDVCQVLDSFYSKKH